MDGCPWEIEEAVLGSPSGMCGAGRGRQGCCRDAAAGSARRLASGLPFKQPSLAVMAGSHGDEQ